MKRLRLTNHKLGLSTFYIITTTVHMRAFLRVTTPMGALYCP